MSQQLLEFAVGDAVAAHQLAHNLIKQTRMLPALFANPARIIHDDQRHYSGDRKIGAVKAILDTCRGGKTGNEGRMAAGHPPRAKEDVHTWLARAPPLARKFEN